MRPRFGFVAARDSRGGVQQWCLALRRVLDHNRTDLLSLAALLALLEHPTQREAPLLHAAA